MILGFKTHLQDGMPTFFEQKIKLGIGIPQLWGIDIPKIHSLREDVHDRWQAGNSIQMAYDVRTKNYRQFNNDIPELSTCKSTQEIFMTYNWCVEISVDDRYLHRKEIEQLIDNDGLTERQFVDWFFPKGKTKFSGKIIHWTDFKY